MLLRKIFVFAFVLIAVLSLGKFPSQAQTENSDILYDRPNRLVLNGVGEPKQPDEDGYVSYLTESFYPVGFSNDGKFAYYVEPAVEACDCYYAKLVIQDLRTDKILWEYEHIGEEPNEPNDETIESHWKKNEKNFSKKLAQYGIKAEKQFTQYHPSVNYNKDIFTPNIDVRIKIYDDIYVDGRVTLRMLSKKRGKKSIYTKKYDPKEVSGFQGAEISGVLISPFESRVAVIVVEIYRGWEGLPRVTQIKIVGSDLTTRFR